MPMEVQPAVCLSSAWAERVLPWDVRVSTHVGARCSNCPAQEQVLCLHRMLDYHVGVWFGEDGSTPLPRQAGQQLE